MQKETIFTSTPHPSCEHQLSSTLCAQGNTSSVPMGSTKPPEQTVIVSINTKNTGSTVVISRDEWERMKKVVDGSFDDSKTSSLVDIGKNPKFGKVVVAFTMAEKSHEHHPSVSAAVKALIEVGTKAMQELGHSSTGAYYGVVEPDKLSKRG